MDLLNKIFGLDIESIEAVKIDELLKDGAYILDVRTKEEISEKNIPGTKNIPLDRLAKEYEKIPNDQKIYLLCRSGRRSFEAARFLKAKGYDPVNISGGILEYFKNK
ncbi:rhodanese-like domain-containing protein [Peptoniphilus raoultii]|uniref:rhodanese-like domain-containing protein n=1 Tax=Peptoniphilus raoultii TaxID=1776387 RepID=UPI0008DADAF8|nr:rhodanese-like domain-containing protein [Peptoniphilus raoultii]